MFDSTKLLDTIQAEWPLLSSLTLISICEMPPAWALGSAQRAARRLGQSELMACRRQLPKHIQMLQQLHRRWAVAATLAVLLALAVIGSFAALPLSSAQSGVLVIVLCAILLPPVVICNGITRDYTAALSLAAAINGVIPPALR